MIKLIEKKIQIIQIRNSTLDFFCDFFAEPKNRKTILVIYDHECYVTNIGYEEARGFCDEKEFAYFLYYICKEKDVEEQNFEVAERILQNNYIHYVLVKNKIATDESMFFYSDLVMMDETYKKELYGLKHLLIEEGVHIYFVRVPRIGDIKKRTEWNLDSFAVVMNWAKAREKQMKAYLKKFTDLEYAEAKRKVMSIIKAEEQIGEGSRTIFLVGPCIIGGWENYPEDRFSTMLWEKIQELGLDYKIKNIVINQMPNSNTKEILEYDIKQNDIVFIVEGILDREKSDLELDYIYTNYNGDKWLYSDVPMHTTRKGNELIINELIDKFIQPIANASEDVNDYNILHKGKKQLTYEESVLLREYIDNIKMYHNFSSGGGIIGACVMTCNPFTKGHYYLIQYAAKQVELLYIFIVEEDNFFFPFEDRLKMVCEGVKDLKNVIVLPGGKFIISKATFKNYFEKELCQDTIIDAAKDIMIFRDYIAPALDISKRFIGEEPTDNITNQYNHLLKESLPDKVDVIEIPRKKVNKDIISASKVRTYLEENKWIEIEKLVPRTTLNYLMQNIEKIRKKEKQNEALRTTIAFVKTHKKIVVCGLGDDCNRIMEHLKAELNVDDIEKLEFYDKKASESNYQYMGKTVISFNELIENYKEYYLLITTSIFKKELFYAFINNGVKPEHIKIASENI